MTDYHAFAVGLLAALGAPNTSSTAGFLTAWMAREGTTAANNPLATTEPWPGASDFNSVGVKNYATEADGVAATVATLTGGYPAIVADLRAGDGGAAGNEHGELSKWSGGGYDTIGAGGGAGNVGQGGRVSGDSWLQGLGHTVGEIIIDGLTIIGLGLGGGQAAAEGELTNLRQDALHETQSTVLTPDLLAAAVLKGQIDPNQAADEATRSGINNSRFGVMVNTQGNPPGPAEILRMYNRGIIDQPTAQLGLRESYLRNEWVGQVLALRHDILDRNEAVNAAVQNHLDYDTARNAALLDGLPPDVFDVMYENAGNPPGPQEILTMLVRGIMDLPTAEQALRESRLKDKYIPAVLQMARRRIPLRSITQLLNAGAISDQQALADLGALGYSPDDAAAIVAGHKTTAHATQKELSVSATRELYTDKMIDANEAAFDLVRIGYTQAAADELVALWGGADERSLRKAAVARVRSAYDARRITRQEASNALDALAVPPSLRDEQLSVWTIEQGTVSRELSPADVAAAGRLGIFTTDETIARLTAMGYSPADALTFAQVHRAAPLPTTPGG